MRYRYINYLKEAEEVVNELLREEVLAFDIETQPLFRYPRQKRTKKEYLEHFAYLKRNRWGLSYNPSPDEITEPLPPPAPLDERLRLFELLEAERNNPFPRSKKAQERRIAELEDAISAMSDATAPDWVLLHIANIIRTEQFANDPVRPGLDPYSSRVFLVQLGTRARMNYCFNVVRIGLDVLRPIFETVPLIGANLVFDVQFLLHNLNVFPRIAWDVIVADRVLTLGFTDIEHHLADVAKRWINERLDKSIRETFAQPFQLEATDQQIRYACTDVDILFPIYDRQRQFAQKTNQLEAVELFVQLTNPTAAVEYCGFRIDKARWLELAEEAERRERQAAEALAAFLNINPDDLTKRAVVLDAANALGIALDTLDRVEREEVRKVYDGDERGRFF